jgi:hypothetical protein
VASPSIEVRIQKESKDFQGISGSHLLYPVLFSLDFLGISSSQNPFAKKQYFIYLRDQKIATLTLSDK